MNNDRRSFLKKLMFGTAVAVAGSTIKSGKAAARSQKANINEVLYRETSAFREYYRSLKS